MADDDYAREADSPERAETPAERLDRNWSELLQELRVTQTGIQILSGFLLILPFQARFEDLSSGLLVVYLLAVLFGTMATGIIIAPVTAHRIYFRLKVKDRLVLLGDLLAKIGLLCFAVSVGLVVTLVIGLTVGPLVGVVTGAAAFLVFMFLWVALPMIVVRRNGDGP